MRILIVSNESIPGAEGRNLPLALELTRRGHQIRHTGPARGMVGQGLTLTTYGDDFAESAEARRADTRLFSTWAGLNRMIEWTEVVVFSSVKGYDAPAEYAFALGKVIIWQLDFLFHMWCPHADLLAVSGWFDLHRLAALTGLDTKRIAVTGSVMYDYAAPGNMRLDRREFCRRYGLDEGKKLAVWLPGSPASHNALYKERYLEICRTVAGTPGFELIIKPHPRDYDGVKQDKTYEDAVTKTWEQIAPGFTVCRAEDKWDCFRHAEVLISRHTTAAVEAALFGKPTLLVDLLDYGLGRIGLDDPALIELLPGTAYSPPGLKELNMPKRLEWTLLGVNHPEAHRRLAWFMKRNGDNFPTGMPEYLGTECTLAELPGVLASGGYRLDDPALFEAYLAKYCRANDGLAHRRVADLVESVAADPILSRKAQAAGSRSRLMTRKTAWSGRAIVRRTAGRLGFKRAGDRP